MQGTCTACWSTMSLQRDRMQAFVGDEWESLQTPVTTRQAQVCAGTLQLQANRKLSANMFIQTPQESHKLCNVFHVVSPSCPVRGSFAGPKRYLSGAKAQLVRWGEKGLVVVVKSSSTPRNGCRGSRSCRALQQLLAHDFDFKAPLNRRESGSLKHNELRRKQDAAIGFHCLSLKQWRLQGHASVEGNEGRRIEPIDCIHVLHEGCVERVSCRNAGLPLRLCR